MDSSNSEKNSQDASQIDAQIAILINEYFDRKQKGEDITPESFATEHAEVSEDLQPYLEGLSLLNHIEITLNDSITDETYFSDSISQMPEFDGYHLLEEIGRGGMGVVYKALQLSTKRLVALKVMLAGPFASTAACKRFEREVELAARLQHEGIVRVLESGRIDQRQYYAMDYVPGVSLDTYIKQNNPDTNKILRLFQQVCENVDNAHRHGVIHRDLKPSNIIMDNEGNSHILDFGLAKAIDQNHTNQDSSIFVSLPGQIMGTLAYISPEQTSGESDEVDARTDVYALGILLYEALTGDLPYDTTGKPSQVVLRIQETRPTRPSTLSDKVNNEIEIIILKALEKDKERRYPSAREMAEDIGRYLAGDPILARRPSSLYILRKKLIKYRWRVGITLVVMLLILSGVTVNYLQKQQDLLNAKYKALSYQQDMELGHIEGSMQNANAFHERYPDLPEAKLLLAQSQRREPDGIPFCIRKLESWLAADPTLWYCQFILAELYEITGNLDRVESLRKYALANMPQNGESYYLRSFATLKLNKALQFAELAVELEPEDILAWRRVTKLKLNTEDYTGTIDAARQLIKLGDNTITWEVYIGDVLLKQGKIHEAITEYNKVGDYGLIRLAHAYRYLKEYKRAIEYYTRAIDAEGNKMVNVWYIYHRATPFWISGRGERALNDYKKVRSLLGKPFFSDVRYIIILHELGRNEEADAHLQQALEEVENPSWLRQIFRCMAGEISPAELVEDGLSRNNLEIMCEACYYAGEVCLLQNKVDEARQWFEKSVETNVVFDPDTAMCTPMNEYELAGWRLNQISQNDDNLEDDQ